MEIEERQKDESEIYDINQARFFGRLTNKEARKKKKQTIKAFGFKSPLEKMIFNQAFKIATETLLKTSATYGLMESSGINDYLINLIAKF